MGSQVSELEARNRRKMMRHALMFLLQAYEDKVLFTRVEFFGIEFQTTNDSLEYWTRSILRRLRNESVIEMIGTRWYPKYKALKTIPISEDVITDYLTTKGSGKSSADTEFMQSLKDNDQSSLVESSVPPSTVLEQEHAFQALLVQATPRELIDQVDTWGVSLRAANNEIIFDGETEALPGALLRHLQLRKAEIVRYLHSIPPRGISDRVSAEVSQKPAQTVSKAEALPAVAPASETGNPDPSEMLSALVNIIPHMVEAISRIERIAVSMDKKISHIHRDLVREGDAS